MSKVPESSEVAVHDWAMYLADLTDELLGFIKATDASHVTVRIPGHDGDEEYEVELVTDASPRLVRISLYVDGEHYTTVEATPSDDVL